MRKHFPTTLPADWKIDNYYCSITCDEPTRYVVVAEVRMPGTDVLKDEPLPDGMLSSFIWTFDDLDCAQARCLILRQMAKP